jgi:hypothetical protein
MNLFFLDKFKIILIIIFVSTSFSNSSIYAQQAGSDKYNYDYIRIDHFENFPGALNRPLKIYDNKNLIGNPSFVIDNFNVIDLRKIKKQRNSQVDFISYVQVERKTPLDLAISSYKNGIAEMKDKTKTYFTKIDASIFFRNEYPFALWRKIKGKKALIILKKIIKNEEDLKKQFEKMNLCISKKDIICTRELFNETEFSFAKKGHALWEFINLPCQKYYTNEVWRYKQIPLEYDEVREIISKSIVPWESLSKLFSLNLNGAVVVVSTKNFGEIDEIEVTTNDDLLCDGKAKISTVVKLKKEKDALSRGGAQWSVRLFRFTTTDMK